MPEGQWYNNRELFELINELRDEMRETRHLMSQYNGLREELGSFKEKVEDVEKKVDDMEARSAGRNSVGKAIREWGGWIIALISLIFLFL